MPKTIRLNIVANYVGSAWSALMGFIFIPLYIHYLGVESYGLIGVFGLVQTWLTLFDFGLAPTLSREISRYSAGGHSPQSIRDLMRSVETVYALIAVSVALAVTFSSSWFAEHWLHAEGLPLETVIQALVISGFLIASRWMSSLYKSAMAGAQEQVWLNGITMVSATLRGLGAVAVLAWLSPTIQAFFLYQLAVAIVELVIARVSVGRILPPAPLPARFKVTSLRQVWRFAAGTMAIGLLSVVLTQMDKLFLIGVLPLREFGYYSLAGSVSGVILILVSPIGVAIGPRLNQLAAAGDTTAIRIAYHRFAQLVSLSFIPAALVICFFSDHLLLLWTRDPIASSSTSSILSVLVAASLFNGIAHVPYLLRLAYGRLRLIFLIDAVMLVTLVLSLTVLVPRYGALGAAGAWLTINVGYVLLAVPIMHLSVLRGEASKWYTADVMPALIASSLVLTLFRLLSPSAALATPMASVALIVLATICAETAAALATPLGRQLLMEAWVRVIARVLRKPRVFDGHPR